MGHCCDGPQWDGKWDGKWPPPAWLITVFACALVLIIIIIVILCRRRARGHVDHSREPLLSRDDPSLQQSQDVLGYSIADSAAPAPRDAFAGRRVRMLADGYGMSIGEECAVRGRRDVAASGGAARVSFELANGRAVPGDEEGRGWEFVNVAGRRVRLLADRYGMRAGEVHGVRGCRDVGAGGGVTYELENGMEVWVDDEGQYWSFVPVDEMETSNVSVTTGTATVAVQQYSLSTAPGPEMYPQFGLTLSDGARAKAGEGVFAQMEGKRRGILDAGQFVGAKVKAVRPPAEGVVREGDVIIRVKLAGVHGRGAGGTPRWHQVEKKDDFNKFRESMGGVDGDKGRVFPPVNLRVIRRDADGAELEMTLTMTPELSLQRSVIRRTDVEHYTMKDEVRQESSPRRPPWMNTGYKRETFCAIPNDEQNTYARNPPSPSARGRSNDRSNSPGTANLRSSSPVADAMQKARRLGPADAPVSPVKNTYAPTGASFRRERADDQKESVRQSRTSVGAGGRLRRSSDPPHKPRS